MRWRGPRLLYIAGCDYHRLSMHPRVLAAVRGALKEVGMNGLNTSGACKTASNYGHCEAALAGARTRAKATKPKRTAKR